jgi:hypothetical protein
VQEVNGDETPLELGHLNWIFIRESDDCESAFQKQSPSRPVHALLGGFIAYPNDSLWIGKCVPHIGLLVRHCPSPIELLTDRESYGASFRRNS